MNDILYIVCPLYNEEEIFLDSNLIISEKLKNLIDNKVVSAKSRIVYVNDGSTDNTLDLIKEEANKNFLVKYINLSRNFGQQSAIMAGIQNSKGKADMVFSIDFDLQDDIDMLDKFIEEYKKGNEIVFGVRNSRKEDTFFKRNTAIVFYKIMHLLGTQIVYNHSECRLMGKKAINALCEYKEVNLFLRGVVKDLGFKTSEVVYDRKSRKKGKTKYNINKMYNLAKEGVLSFSVAPLKLITRIGIIIFFISMLKCINALIGYIRGENIIGWTTIVALICLFSGFQILCIGVIGEYIAKIYSETKKRPLYIIDDTNLE